MANLQLVALIVSDYDEAIHFFVDILQFELAEDTPSLTNDGRPKRWVVVRPVGGQAGILLAKADGDDQVAAVGHQFVELATASRDIARRSVRERRLQVRSIQRTLSVRAPSAGRRTPP